MANIQTPAASSSSPSALRPYTMWYMRRVVYSCNHHAQQPYPVRDPRVYSNEEEEEDADANAPSGPEPLLRATRIPSTRPLLLALRVNQPCIPCAQRAALGRRRANALNSVQASVHEHMASLQARLDRILSRAAEDDEAWPEEAPAVGDLLKPAAKSSSSSAAAVPRKLSEGIRLVREDLARRMAAWEERSSSSNEDKDKGKGKAVAVESDEEMEDVNADADVDAVPELTKAELDRMSLYEAEEKSEVVKVVLEDLYE